MFQIFIDMVKKWFQCYLKGMIVLWSGTTANIPDGWAICDGDNGTPDLRTKFVLGNGPGVPPHTTGGTFTHDHDFTGDGHYHRIETGTGMPEGYEYRDWTVVEPAIGTTDAGSHVPPYYVLAFIMKL